MLLKHKDMTEILQMGRCSWGVSRRDCRCRQRYGFRAWFRRVSHNLGRYGRIKRLIRTRYWGNRSRLQDSL